MSWSSPWCWIACCALAVACDSNPTPHPANDAGYDTMGADTAQPSNEKGPDDDHDGVPDCDEHGGFWDGAVCQGGTAATDTSGGDTVRSDGTGETPNPDAVGAGDAIEGGDAADAGDTADASDAADGSADAASDSGPDAAD